MEDGKVLLFDIDGTIVQSPNWWRQHDDATETLELLSQQHRLGLFSQGFRMLQLFKLRRLGILSLFDPQLRIISLNKISSLKKYLAQGSNERSHCYIIDNEIEKIKKIQNEGLGVELIYLNRDAKHHSITSSVNFNEISTLTQLPALLDKLDRSSTIVYD